MKPPLPATRLDPLSESERSERMSRVRPKGNKSTELAATAAFRRHGVTGWRRHQRIGLGRPDFYFPAVRLAVWLDGCFWHSCPKCARRVPQSRTEFWGSKLEQNRKRDRRIRGQLRRAGVSTLRIWEHELRDDRWVRKVMRRLEALASGPAISELSGVNDANHASN